MVAINFGVGGREAEGSVPIVSDMERQEGLTRCWRQMYVNVALYFLDVAPLLPQDPTMEELRLKDLE